MTSRQLLRRWSIHVTIGEFIGFLIPIGVWASLATAGLSDAALYLPVVAAGAAEGLVLGSSQARVLAVEIEGFERGEWIRNTSAAACAAWAVGMAPAVISDSFGVPDVVLGGIGAAAVIVMLFSIGWAQSLVLRRHVGDGGAWVRVNALAWFAGVPFTFIALGAAPDDDAWRVLFAAVGGLAMAATVALLTGLVLMRLLSRAGAGRTEQKTTAGS